MQDYYHGYSRTIEEVAWLPFQKERVSVKIKKKFFEGFSLHLSIFDLSIQKILFTKLKYQVE